MNTVKSQVSILVVMFILAVVIIIAYINFRINREMFDPRPLNTNTSIPVGTYIHRIDNFNLLVSKYRNSDTTIIYYHGRYGNFKLYLPLVEACRAMKVNLVLCDYPGYGLSRKVPDMSSFLSSSRKTYEYVRRTLFPTGKCIVWGESLGGFAALHTISHFSERVYRKEINKSFLPDNLVLLSTFSSIPGIFGIDANYIDVLQLIMPTYNNAQILSYLNVRTTIIHSTEDRFIPFECANILQKSGHSDCEIIKISGDHTSPHFTQENIIELSRRLDMPETDKVKQATEWLNKMGKVVVEFEKRYELTSS
jgi:hypothetical protein